MFDSLQLRISVAGMQDSLCDCRPTQRLRDGIFCRLCFGILANLFVADSHYRWYRLHPLDMAATRGRSPGNDNWFAVCRLHECHGMLILQKSKILLLLGGRLILQEEADGAEKGEMFQCKKISRLGDSVAAFHTP
jgi:hypothetical protein